MLMPQNALAKDASKDAPKAAESQKKEKKELTPEQIAKQEELKKIRTIRTVESLKQHINLLSVGAQNMASGIDINRDFKEISTIFLDYMSTQKQVELPRGYRFLNGQINSIKTKEDLARVMGVFTRYSLKTPLKAYPMPIKDTIGFQNTYRSFFSSEKSPERDETVKKYKTFMTDLFKELYPSVTPKQIDDALAIMEKISITPTGKKPVITKPLDRKTLTKLKFPWKPYFEGYPKFSQNKFRIVNPKEVGAFAQVFATAPIEAWKTVLRLDLASAFVRFLPKKYEDIYLKHLTENKGKKVPKTVLGVDMLQRLLPAQMSNAYAQAFMTPELRKNLTELAGKVKAKVETEIKGSDLTPKVKKAILNKLTKMNIEIGYTKPIKVKKHNLKPGNLVENVLKLRLDSLNQALVAPPKKQPMANKAPLSFNKKTKKLFIPAARLQPYFYSAGKEPKETYYHATAKGLANDILGYIFINTGDFTKQDKEAIKAEFPTLKKVINPEKIVTADLYKGYPNPSIPATRISDCVTKGCKL